MGLNLALQHNVAPCRSEVHTRVFMFHYRQQRGILDHILFASVAFEYNAKYGSIVAFLACTTHLDGAQTKLSASRCGFGVLRAAGSLRVPANNYKDMHRLLTASISS